VSSASDAMCLAVVRGITKRLPIEIAWQGEAEKTFDLMCSTYSLTQLHAVHNGTGLYCRKHRAQCFVYIAKATSFDDSFSIYKVGATHDLEQRMQVHKHIPVLRWSNPVFAECYSFATARLAETAMLASAAAAGFWIGGEWIAGCSTTQARLAVGKETTRKDRRYRVRVNHDQEFSDGM